MSNLCPSKEELLEFHLGKLQQSRLDSVAEHLETCANCEAAVESLESAADPLLSILLKPASPVSLRLRSREDVARTSDPAAPENWPRLATYEVLGFLGRGGMGAVYRARHLRLNRLVALKRLSATGDRGPGRSQAEAEALAHLHHPNIVQVYEVFEHEDATYLALELIEGGALGAKLGKPLVPGQAAKLLASLAGAVHYAHELGVVHRDLKPDNILLEPGEDESGLGAPKITDFGVAKRLTVTAGETQEGDIVGTPNYMAPEQAAGNLHQVGPVADIYSLGVILYEMLTGRVPIQGPTTLDTLALVRTEEPVAPRRLQPRIGRDLETICLKCLEKQPNRRYPTAAQLADDLRRFLNDEPIRARPPSALYQLRKFAARNKTLIGGIVGVTAALVLGLTTTLLFAIAETGQHRLADENARVALREAYRGRIAAAAAALQAHDVAEAARQLLAAPESLRGWEWRHFQSRLDESSAVYRAGPGQKLSIVPSANGMWLSLTTDSETRLQRTDGPGLKIYPFGIKNVLHAGLTSRDTWFSGPSEIDSPMLDHEGRELPGIPRSRRFVLSPDLKSVAASGGNESDPEGRFSIFELATGKTLASFVGHRGYIYDLAFSPDGSQIASASEDGTARIWNGITGREIAVLRGHTVKVYSVAYRPDGKRVLTTSGDGTVRQWDPQTGAEVEAPYDRHTGEVAAAAYSPDGTWVASGGSDRTVRIWNSVGRKEIAVLHGHIAPITRIVFSADGRRLTSADSANTARVWELDSRLALPVLRGHTSYVYPVAYSPDGQWIASGSWDGSVRLWAAATGQSRLVLQHASRVLDLAFTPDGSGLVIGCGDDDYVQLRDIATGKVLKVFKGLDGSAYALAVSPDGSLLAVMDRGGATSIFATASGTRTCRLETGGLSKLHFSPDGHWLGVGGLNGAVYLWNVQTSRHAADLVGHTAPLSTVSFSQDSRWVISAGQDRTVRIWDISTRKCLSVLSGHPDVIFAAEIHPDASRIASAGRDGVIWLWDVDAQTEVARLQGHTNYIWSLAFSPDGKSLASASGDGTLRVWDTQPAARRHQVLRELEARRDRARLPKVPGLVDKER